MLHSHDSAIYDSKAAAKLHVCDLIMALQSNVVRHEFSNIARGISSPVCQTAPW